jgi:hypothetical protein
MDRDIFLAFGIVLLLAAFLLWQWRERRAARELVKLARAGGTYHCVEVRSRGKPCASAQSVSGKRFLSGMAPPIPLPGCTALTCRCAYVHFEDRRTGERRSPFASHARRELGDEPERRRRVDRRRKTGLRTAEAF